MQTLREKQGPPLPLSSLRLLVPPLRLVCAAMWQIVERRDVMDYGLLEEFATAVLEIVPELMTYRERVQLLMGLRARLILELCRCDDELCRPDTVQPHLNRIRSCISSQEVSDPKVEASEASFSKLIETLLEEPDERELFFQNVFPEEFGSKYDSTLQMLVQEFLSRLEKLLPPPNLQQTASWLSIEPALIEECVQSVAHPEPLQTLLHTQKHGQQLDTNALRSVGGDYILSSLSSRCSGKEGSASSDSATDRPSHPTMKGYQSPLPCEEPGMRWDCRLADSRVWTVKPTAGAACVPVVDTPEVATEKGVKRKAVDRDTIKEARRDKAVLCPQTRSGLKTSRLTASCLCRKPVLQLNRLDVSNMPLPKSLLTLILRRGRPQAEATGRPGPKRRGRKKKGGKGHSVTNQKMETHTLAATPLLASSLKLTLKRGIVQAEATSSQVPKKRGRKKGQKIAPAVTKLKIEKIAARSLDISDVPLPKPSLKLIIRRGKLQAELTGAQGQFPKRRGRKKKHRRGCGVKDEKPEAKGVKRDRSAETEEEAKPSDYELWTTVRKGAGVHNSATVDQSGGVQVGLKCPSTDKREEELPKHTLHVPSEEHCGQNREELLEPSNTSHKIHIHSEDKSGTLAEEQKKVEVLTCNSLKESVPQDSLTESVPQDSLTETVPQESLAERVPQDSLAERVPQDSLAERVPQDSLTERVPQDSLTEKAHQYPQLKKVPQDSLTERVPQDSLKDRVPQDSLTERIPQDSLIKWVPQDSIKERVPQDSLTKKVPQESLTERVPQNSLKEREPHDSLTEKVPKDSLTERIPHGSLTEKVLQDSLTERVPQDSLTERVPLSSLTEKVPQESLTENVPQESLTENDLLTQQPSNTCHKRSQRVKACSFCGKTFTDTLDLTRHMRSHIEQKSHQCHQCGQDFEFGEDFEEHKNKGCVVNKNRYDDDNNKDSCKETKERNTNQEKKLIKREKITKLKRDKKTDLKKVKRNDFKGDEELVLKEDENHDLKDDEQADLKEDENPDLTEDEKPVLKGDTQHCSIKCHVCGKITTRMLGLRRHLLVHFNNGAFKCPVCPKTFTTNADLRSHLRLKRSCREKCPEEFIMTTVQLQSVPCQNICPYCGDTFQLPHDLKGHTRECSRKCHVCGKTTLKPCNMQRHLLKHYNNGPIKCPVCPKTFISHPDFKMHLKTKKRCREKCSDVIMKELLSSVEGKCKENINETEVMTRPQQPSSSSTVKSMEEFFEELAHDNSKNCDSLHVDLNDKMSQNQPIEDIDQSTLCEYQCPYCRDTFQLPHELKGHTKECSRKCHVCGKTSSKACDMRRHMLKHYNNGPIKCPVCPKTFIFHTDLKIHLKTKKMCREKCSDVMMKELMSSVDGRRSKKVNESGEVTKCQQPSSSNTNGPVLGLKSFEKLFEELPADSQPANNNISSDVNINSLHKSYSDKINDYEPMNDVDLNSLDDDHKVRISQKPPMRDIDISNPTEFNCHFCGDTFQLPHDLKSHTKNCSKKCHVCGKTSSKTCDLRRHMLKHDNNGPIKCPVCPKTFIFHTDLKTHLKTKKFCREKCPDVMAKESPSSVDSRHRNKLNKTRVMTKCQPPSSSSTSVPVLGLKSFEEFFEELSHDSDISMSTDVNLISLHEETSGRNSHNQPMKDTGQSNPGEYKCPYCGDTFQLPHVLKGHTKECSRRCNVCGKTTSTTCGMRRHMLKHYNNGSHRCPVCPKTFIFYTDMKKHLKSKRLCRENFSNEMAKDSLSSVDGQYKEHVNETGVMARPQQPSSSNTDQPVLGLKSFEEFFEDLPQDQPNEGMSSDGLRVDFNEEISQYQPMKDVDLNNLQEDYSDEIHHYQPMNDVDLNSLHGHYINDIRQY